MNYVSVCSGIEAASVAWDGLGWTPKAFAEIEKFPSSILDHHYPDVPNVGDFTKISGDEYGSIDLLVGGTPCQDFSVAGLRAGLDGKRGQLTIEFTRLAGRIRPRWLVWENVPGVLSIERGRAFGTFLRALGELGYGFAYRILDAQYFGVPQRRRRVFVVGYLGDWRPAAAVLLERESLLRNPPPRREKGKKSSTSFTPSSHGCYSEGLGTLRANGGDIGGGSETLLNWPVEVAPTLDAHYGDKQGLENQHIDGGGVSLCLTSHYAKGGDPTVDNLLVTGGFFDQVAYRVHGEHSTAMTSNGIANVADPVDTARCLDSCGGYASNQGGNIVLSAERERHSDRVHVAERRRGFL